MKLFGVTGGVGMGKSTVAQSLERHHIPVIDTDTISRKLTQPGQPALAEIFQLFGAEILNPDGSLDRAELARIVFQDADARADLEAILHPAIRAEWESEVARWRAGGRKHGAVIIPLLFETAAEKAFDAVICVACSSGSQLARLRERGWSEDQIVARIEAQMPIEQKITRSDFVVWTDTPVHAAEAQLLRIIDTADTLQKTPACA